MLRTPWYARARTRHAVPPRLERVRSPRAPGAGTMARLSAFEVGQIKAHLHHGLGPTAIAGIVLKADGSHVSVQGVCDTEAKLEADPAWRGERAAGSGRPRKTQPSMDRTILRAVVRGRGRAKVTVAYLKKQYPELRPLSNSLVQGRLHEAGLKYLRRRRKTLVPGQHKDARMAFAQRVQRMHASTLDRWAYTDGTVFFLDRDAADNESSRRAALGRFVWRRTDGKDALYGDCVGPSSYAKGQGVPVRVWGLLSHGRLHVTVLPARQAMNRWWYAWVVKRYFPYWLDGCDKLVQDYERCLRCDEPLEELRKLSVEVISEYPKCSQDLNAIENAWNVLRERLDATLPTGMESREAFLLRLRAAVAWINAHRAEQLLKFCTNQKERAAEVCLREGGRTSF